MPTRISLPTTTTNSTPTSQFPASANNGIVEDEVDVNGNTYQWAWNAAAGLWLSTDTFSTGLSGQSSNGLGLTILSTQTLLDLAYQMPGGCSFDKIWLVKSSVVAMPLGTSVLGGTYFSSTTNELRGVNNYTFALNNFTTKTSILNAFTVFDTSINQVFNSRLMDWHLTITKSGLDVIALRLNFGLEYKLIRY